MRGRRGRLVRLRRIEERLATRALGIAAARLAHQRDLVTRIRDHLDRLATLRERDWTAEPLSARLRNWGYAAQEQAEAALVRADAELADARAHHRAARRRREVTEEGWLAELRRVRRRREEAEAEEDREDRWRLLHVRGGER